MEKKLSGYGVLIWSIAYMLPHLYWALGGKDGMTMFKPSIMNSPYLQSANWAASVLLTTAGLLGLAMIYFNKNKIISTFLLAIALFGCSVSTSHGIYGVAFRIIQLLKGQGHAYDSWDLFLYEPWFLIEGILLGLAGWVFLNQPRHKHTWLMLCAAGIIVGLFTGLIGVRFA